MFKTISILLVFLLIANVAFANPQASPSGNNKAQLIILSVITFGIGLFIYKLFTHHDKAEFTEEEIEITLRQDGSVEVDGEYKFTRTGNQIKYFKVVYPFPKQIDFGEVEILELSYNGKRIEYHPSELKYKDNLALELYFDRQGECLLKIRFVQIPLKNEYKYILKSTKTWNKPLVSSRINLNIAGNFELEDCSYALNVIQQIEEEFAIYQLEEFDFYPDEDLDFSWEDLK